MRKYNFLLDKINKIFFELLNKRNKRSNEDVFICVGVCEFRFQLVLENLIDFGSFFDSKIEGGFEEIGEVDLKFLVDCIYEFCFLFN